MSTPEMASAAPPGWAEVVELLRQAVGEDHQWVTTLTPETRVDSDLFLDSVELAGLSDLVSRRYGDHIDLLAYVADLDIDQLIALNLGDVARYVADQTAATQPIGPG